MNEDIFNNATGLIVSQIEGGYYHPDMLADGRVKDNRYATSGETMFGIDRKNGGVINDTAAGKKFWSIIDTADAKDNWKWNYNGGELAPQLKDLAAQMMLPSYQILASKTLSPKAQNIVEGNPGLLLHFIYAVWNGPGWFSVFAKKINAAVDSGADASKLLQVAKDSRLNSTDSLIRQGGAKIADLMDSLGSTAAGAATGGLSKLRAFVKKYPLELGLGLTLFGIGVSVYLGTRNNGNANSNNTATTQYTGQ